MRFWNPLPVDRLLKILREMPIPRESEVLDYGCGPGEISRELVNGFNARITGVDPNREAIARCRAKMPGRFLEEAFRTERFPAASFDLIVNIGASPGMLVLLEQVLPLLRRPGRLLVGDTYWRCRPSDELLDFLGAPSAEIPMLEEHHAALTRNGFVVERILLAAETDWDQYEEEYDGNMIAYLKEHPTDPSFESFERRRREWRNMYLQHARGRIGFALYQARLEA
jgi:SAM-dependent methyltransferase